jgi:hypothetical protein
MLISPLPPPPAHGPLCVTLAWLPRRVPRLFLCSSRCYSDLRNCTLDADREFYNLVNELARNLYVLLEKILPHLSLMRAGHEMTMFWLVPPNRSAFCLNQSKGVSNAHDQPADMWLYAYSVPQAS